MDATDGLTRGQAVINTGEPIKVPVGRETLGRIMNVIGEPVDEKGPIRECPPHDGLCSLAARKLAVLLKQVQHVPLLPSRWCWAVSWRLPYWALSSPRRTEESGPPPCSVLTCRYLSPCPPLHSRQGHLAHPSGGTCICGSGRRAADSYHWHQGAQLPGGVVLGCRPGVVVGQGFVYH
jgi:hypothetical protein